MRLGSRVLIGAFLAAAMVGHSQAPVGTRDRRLSWESALARPPWQAEEAGTSAPPPMAVPAPTERATLSVRWAADGSLGIVDPRGVLRLKLGLPGRVARLWRDGGAEVDRGVSTLGFPATTPLSKGIAELPWGQADFRPGLQGLLWILDDGERILTVVHPATARVQYIALPPVSGPELVFWPDHLELREASSDDAARQSPRRWILPWPGLLPQLLRLSQPAKQGRHGTAFQPFPRD